MRQEPLMDWGDADEHGECSVCGQHREKINSGELKPCYAWERITEKETEDGNE